MNPQETVFDDDALGRPWLALGWLILAAAVAVTAFLLAPLP